jgi:hypothetical protein
VGRVAVRASPDSRRNCPPWVGSAAAFGHDLVHGCFFHIRYHGDRIGLARSNTRLVVAGFDRARHIGLLHVRRGCDSGDDSRLTRPSTSLVGYLENRPIFEERFAFCELMPLLGAGSDRSLRPSRESNASDLINVF